MLARSAQRHSDLTNIEVVPVGLDYEHFVDWRRRFRLRIGAPVRYADLLDKDGSIDKPALNERIRDAFRKVMVDIQPSDAQPYLHPAMRAERTTQLAPMRGMGLCRGCNPGKPNGPPTKVARHREKGLRPVARSPTGPSLVGPS